MTWDEAFKNHEHASFLYYQFSTIVKVYDTMFSEYANSNIEVNVSELAKMFNEEMLTRSHSIEDYDWTETIEKALTAYLFERKLNIDSNLKLLEIRYSEYDWTETDSAIVSGMTASLEIGVKKTKCTTLFDYVISLMVSKAIVGIMKYNSLHHSNSPGLNLVDERLLARYIQAACWMEDPEVYLRYKKFFDVHAEEIAHKIVNMYRKHR